MRGTTQRSTDTGGRDASVIVIFFRKAGEDPTQVAYVFGPSRKSLGRRLVFDKSSYAAWPDDGQLDIMFEGATVKILRLVRSDGVWPDRGVHALRPRA